MNIIINGKQHNVTTSRITYEGILKLAGYDPNRNISTTYYSRNSNNTISGILSKGESLSLIEGMSITSIYTGEA